MPISAKTDFGLYSQSNQFRVTDWRKKVSMQDSELYKELQSAVKEASSDAIKNQKVYSLDKLKIIARTILRAENEQKKIVYKYDFSRFVEEMFVGDSELQDKLKTPEFHVEMYNAFQQSRRVCIVCPRGHGKSSVSRLYILHQILNQQVRYVIILGSSEDMAGQNMRWIRDQLIENEKIIDVYGNLQGKGKWAETEFITSTGIKVIAKGAGQKIRGANEKGRPDLIYIDDLESDDEVGSKENRIKLASWFTKAVLPIRSRDGRFIVTGTILHVDSLLKNIALNRYRDHIPWSVLWYQALYTLDDNTQVSLWPEMHPVANLLELKKNDEQTFAQEYQNNPSSGGMAVFNKAWYVHILRSDIEITGDGVYVLGRKVNVMITTDLAISEKEGSDYTVIIASGMDDRGVLYLLDIKRFRTSDIFDIINEIFLSAKTYNTDFVSIETVAFQRTIKRQIEREFDARQQYLHIEERSRTRTTKMARIKSLQAPIKIGKIQWLDEFTDLENELDSTTATRLPVHDDILDATADAWELQLEFRAGHRKEEPQVNTLEWLIAQGRCQTSSQIDLARAQRYSHFPSRA